MFAVYCTLVISGIIVSTFLLLFYLCLSKKLPANLRYRFLKGGLVSLLLLSFVPFIAQPRVTWSEAPKIRLPSAAQAPTLRPVESAISGLDLRLWLVGIFGINLLGGLIVIGRGLWSASQLQRLAQRSIGETFAGNVPILLHTKPYPPATTGWLNPKILMQKKMWDQLNEKQRQLVIAHELVHIQRRDYMFLWIMQFLKGVLFLAPGIWILAKHFREEMELSCDEQVLNTQTNRIEYGHLLVDLTALLSKWVTPPVGGIYISQNFLTRRIVAMGQQKSRHRRWVPWMSLLTFATVSSLSLAAPKTQAFITNLASQAHLDEDFRLAMTLEIQTFAGDVEVIDLEDTVARDQPVLIEIGGLSGDVTVQDTDDGLALFTLKLVKSSEGEEEVLVLKLKAPFGETHDHNREFEENELGIQTLDLTFTVRELQ